MFILVNKPSSQEVHNLQTGITYILLESDNVFVLHQSNRPEHYLYGTDAVSFWRQLAKYVHQHCSVGTKMLDFIEQKPKR